MFLSEFKCRLIDSFKQEWFSNLEKSPVLCIYRNVKSCFEYECYLNILPRCFRFYFCRLRMNGLPLKIQTGRFSRNRIPREERYCLFCNDLDIEDEYHFICICKCYDVIRKQYLKAYYYRNLSVYKFTQLLNSQNKNELIRLSKFVKEALSIRYVLSNATV